MCKFKRHCNTECMIHVHVEKRNSKEYFRQKQERVETQVVSLAGVQLSFPCYLIQFQLLTNTETYKAVLLQS